MACGGCGGGRNRHHSTHRLPTTSGGDGVVSINLTEKGLANTVLVKYTGNRIGSFSVFGSETRRAYRFSQARNIQPIAKDDINGILQMVDFRLASDNSPIMKASVGVASTPQLRQPLQQQIRAQPQLQAQKIIQQIMANEKLEAPMSTAPSVQFVPATAITTIPAPISDLDTEVVRTVQESDKEQRQRMRTLKRESKVDSRGTTKVRVYPGM